MNYNHDKKRKITKTAIDKIKKLYANYAIDTTEMDEDEYERIFLSYSDPKKLDEDLKSSEKAKKLFSDDDII